mmetsp:Transcript_63579/g.170133  ORF Transcript_63579/g.170133 Transcript_63579/m.170133 type:complete len:80 (+) Transcript_63579:1574-1813(+)
MRIPSKRTLPTLGFLKVIRNRSTAICSASLVFFRLASIAIDPKLLRSIVIGIAIAIAIGLKLHSSVDISLCGLLRSIAQ